MKYLKIHRGLSRNHIRQKAADLQLGPRAPPALRMQHPWILDHKSSGYQYLNTNLDVHLRSEGLIQFQVDEKPYARVKRLAQD